MCRPAIIPPSSLKIFRVWDELPRPPVVMDFVFWIKYPRTRFQNLYPWATAPFSIIEWPLDNRRSGLCLQILPNAEFVIGTPSGRVRQHREAEQQNRPDSLGRLSLKDISNGHISRCQRMKLSDNHIAHRLCTRLAKLHPPWYRNGT